MVKVKTKTKIIDKGWKNIEKSVKKMDDSFVTIGVHKGVHPYPSGVAVPLVAHWHEYGTQKIPERSFLRSTINQKQTPIWTLIGKQKDMIFKNHISVHKGLTVIGFVVMEMIKGTIKRGGVGTYAFEKLAASTLKNKVTTKPLIDSGRLHRSINFEVTAK
jgi:hypothetical protein